ncbi:fertility inhibition protein FinO [Escherichia coli]
MAGFESAYVALSRMKQHVQVYTDNRQGWTDAINNAVQKGTAHDVFEPKPDREVMNAERLFSTARELRDVAAGRAVLRQAGLAGGDSPARFIAPGRKYPQPYVALPAFDRNGKSAGIWLNPLPTLDDAVNTLKPWWPGLFDGDTPRLLACGIRDVLLEDVAQRNIPLSHKKLRRALKAITRSESYLCAMKAGACRYDTEGYVTEHISQEEEAYAAERLDKIRRQNRIKAELQAVLDEK